MGVAEHEVISMMFSLLLCGLPYHTYQLLLPICVFWEPK